MNVRPNENIFSSVVLSISLEHARIVSIDSTNTYTLLAVSSLEQKSALSLLKLYIYLYSGKFSIFTLGLIFKRHK